MSTFVDFFMARPAFRSAIERRTAPRSMLWCDRTARSRAAANSRFAKDENDDWNREVVQFPKRLRLHPAGGRVERCVRTHIGGRTFRHGQPARRPARELRGGTR